MYRTFTLIALTVAGLATPALAHDRETTEALRDGRCTLQQVHTPAGKMIHSAPIVRCRAEVDQSRDSVANRSERVEKNKAEPVNAD